MTAKGLTPMPPRKKAALALPISETESTCYKAQWRSVPNRGREPPFPLRSRYMKNSISVIVIDDHPIVLQGFSHILQNEEGITLLSSFTAAEAGISYIENHPVDVVLLDINMPDMSGI